MKAWREAATLVTLARHNHGALSRQCNDIKYSTNYRVLFQQRTHTASSFANTVVFPGGVTEKADSSEKWVHLIKSYGYKQQHFDLLHHEGSLITPLFKDNPIQRHIALRITAIRETFEETGLLICSDKPHTERSGHWAETIDVDVPYWQNRVSEDPEQLFNLCEQLNCYPDIWSLHYWSNWLTPITFKKRFDTAFFVTAFEKQPEGLSGSSEVANIGWHSIESTLFKNSKGELLLSPPQLYELKRLLNFDNIDELISFSKTRSGYGTELLYPIVVPCKKGSVSILPGDDHYPTNVDYHTGKKDISDKTTIELREGAHVLHRLEQEEKGRTEFIIENYRPLNHITMNSKIVQTQT